MTGVKQQQAVVTLAGGSTLDLTICNPDMVRWDMTAHKHKWPDMEAAPMLWATFVSWRAAVRTGLYEGTWEKWSTEDCLNVDMPQDDVEDLAEVGPTRSGHEPASV